MTPYPSLKGGRRNCKSDVNILVIMHVLQCLCYFWQPPRHSLCCTSKRAPLISYSSFLSPSLSSALPVSRSLSLPCIDFKRTSCRLRLPGSTDQWGKVGLHQMTRAKEHKPQLLNLANWGSCLLTFSEISLLVPHNCIRGVASLSDPFKQ